MKPRRSRLEKLEASMDQYRATAVYLKEHVKVLIEVFGITVFQRFALFAATWFVYRAFGLSGTSAVVIVILQGTIAVAVDMLPLPGAQGIDIWKPVIASGYDFKPGTWLLHGVVYQCDIYDRGKLYNRKKRRGLIC